MKGLLIALHSRLALKHGDHVCISGHVTGLHLRVATSYVMQYCHPPLMFENVRVVQKIENLFFLLLLSIELFLEHA